MSYRGKVWTIGGILLISTEAAFVLFLASMVGWLPVALGLLCIFALLITGALFGVSGERYDSKRRNRP
jgi:hypothetical protein